MSIIFPITYSILNSAIRIELRSSTDMVYGLPENQYAIMLYQECLDKNGNWVREPFPSNRTEEFIQSTRFSLSDAKHRAIEKYHEMELVRKRVK